jgi:hypothetical protein
MTMKKRIAPNWDDFGGQQMHIPFFVYGRDDIQVGPLKGFCRGHGAISGNEKSYHDTIGIYTTEGVYYNIKIDVRVKCIVPLFFIDGTPFFYPIVACFTMCHGLPVIDPATGIMRHTRQGQNDCLGGQHEADFLSDGGKEI